MKNNSEEDSEQSISNMHSGNERGQTNHQSERKQESQKEYPDVGHDTHSMWKRAIEKKKIEEQNGPEKDTANVFLKIKRKEKITYLMN